MLLLLLLFIVRGRLVYEELQIWAIDDIILIYIVNNNYYYYHWLHSFFIALYARRDVFLT